MSKVAFEKQSCLETCSSEVLNLVTSRLNGADVMALFLCGAPQLSKRLFNEGVSVIRFDWSHPRYRIWYPLVMKFKRLQCLDITADYARFFSRFQLSSHFSTLTELVLTLALPRKEKAIQCLDSWNPQDSSPLNLGEAMPFLEKLILRHFEVSIAFVSLLPPLLLYLDMAYYLSKSNREYCTKTAHIEALPRNLTYLALKSDMDSSEASIKALPSTLKTAKLQITLKAETLNFFPKSLTLLEGRTAHLPLESLNNLPIGIQIVEIVIDQGVPAQEMKNVILPGHVTHLSIAGTQEIPIFETSLPPQLIHLILNNAGSLKDSDFACLPKTLKMLSLSRCNSSLTPVMLKYLPIQLRFLVLGRSEPFKDEWILAGLPPNLVGLDIIPHFSWSNEVLQHLPRSLVNVNIGKMTKLNNQGISLLPPFLTILNTSTTRYVTGKCFRSLPRTLTRFMIDTGDTISDHEISHLPRALKYLRIWGAKFLTDACFKMMPRRLDTLVLNGPGPIFSTARISELPQSITILTFPPEVNHELTTAYFSQKFTMLDSDEREDIELPIYLSPLAPPSPNSGRNSQKKREEEDVSIISSISSIFSKNFWSAKLN
jgi:hypothetical protein